MLIPRLAYLFVKHTPRPGRSRAMGEAHPLTNCGSSASATAGVESGPRLKLACIFLAAALTCALLLSVGVKTAAASGPGSALSPGQRLTAGQYLASTNGQYALVMQSDGNLVEYTQGRAIWSTGTVGHSGAFAIMQSDGNLVVYGPSGEALWNSGTYGHSGASLQLQDDANVVVYYGNQPLWATYITNPNLASGERLTAGQYLVSTNYQYKVVMQSDGNLVEYNAAGTPLWNSGTYGHQGAFAIMQSDGNLVVYGPAGEALWNSGTYGHAGAKLRVEGEDSVFVLSNTGQGLWGANRPWGQILGSNIFPWGQCTWGAEEKFHEFTGTYLNVNGNANEWATSAAAHGWPVLATPQIASVVVFQPYEDGSGSVGHVAWVRGVNGGQITIEETNYTGLGRWDTRVVTPGSKARFILAP
jgi:surface antigen